MSVLRIIAEQLLAALTGIRFLKRERLLRKAEGYFFPFAELFWCSSRHVQQVRRGFSHLPAIWVS